MLIEILYFDGCPNHERLAEHLPRLPRSGSAAYSRSYNRACESSSPRGCRRSGLPTGEIRSHAALLQLCRVRLTVGGVPPSRRRRVSAAAPIVVDVVRPLPDPANRAKGALGLTIEMLVT
jgi:hypothetical protein